MPLVILCGFPSSGKSKRAAELHKYLEENFPEKAVHTVSEKGVKNENFSDSNKEKEMRSNLKSSTTHLLNDKDVVILDSLNYIKGFRYELYCQSKSRHTTQCTIWCDVNRERAAELNESRNSDEQYKPEVLQGLVMRFEEPNPGNRWDSPLFVVQLEDELPMQQICDALFHRKPPPPNRSTQAQPLSSTNFLYELDKATHSTVSLIMEEQKMAIPGDGIKIPGSSEELQVMRPVTLAELHRHRRQFINYTKSHPVDDFGKIKTMFVQYLNKCIT